MNKLKDLKLTPYINQNCKVFHNKQNKVLHNKKMSVQLYKYQNKKPSMKS